MIEVDGSHGEAGGQILRTAVGLSAVTGKPCRIFNIRKSRPKAGLKAQHLSGVKAVALLSGARTSGLALGSTEITFHPQKIRSGKLSIDVGTAGSIGLVLQSLILPSLHAPSPVELEIRGGTHVKWSPSTDYFQHIFCETLKKMGMDIHIVTEKFGFYPQGGGFVRVTVKPGEPKPLALTERGGFIQTEMWSIASEMLKKRQVAERQAKAAEGLLPIGRKSVSYVESLSPGSSIYLHSLYDNCRIGACSLGERGKTAETVGREAAALLKKQMGSGACLDEWMADQILPFLAIADGESDVTVTEITKHSLTNMWVIEQFLPVKFSMGKKDGTPKISVKPS